MKPVAAPLIAVFLSSFALLVGCEGDIKKRAELAAMEVVGNIAERNMPDDIAGGFHRIPIDARQLADGIYQATGVANTHMIVTDAGNVIFDSGLGMQAAKQIKLLKKLSDAPVRYIVLSHSHADHIGGERFWREEGTEVVTHRQFPEEQRYLKALEPYFWTRNRTVFPWMPESPPSMKMVAYGGVEPDILVDHRDHKFELGGKRFEVLAAPGAEGADNLVLWLPEQKILFSGDFFGPLWPQFPNIFTMRGEKIRKPIEYIASLNKLIALEPEMIVPSHHDPVQGAEQIKAGMIRIRDAVQYVHDAVVKGMNDGKSVEQLMDEIQLPERLALTEEHGRVAWAVRSIWEYYATWFHFRSPTELYSQRIDKFYPDIAALTGISPLIELAETQIQERNPVAALHYTEIALAADPDHKLALATQLKALKMLLEINGERYGNNYEKDYLRSLINETEMALGRDVGSAGR